MLPKAFNDLAGIDWEFILDSIIREKCILFLGPELLRDTQDQKLEDALCNYLEIGLDDNPYIRNYYPEDGFFLFREPRFKRRVISKIRLYYDQDFPQAQSLLEKVARIPFRIIVQLTPDNLLVRTFDRLQLPYRSEHFSKARSSVDFIKPTKERPLIFRLLGNIEEDESLILTHNDLYDFLHAIFTPKSLHQDLKEELESASSFIFLGLQFEKWYMQLLLRILSLHTDKTKELDRFALRQSMEMQLKSLYQDQFGIEFINEDTSSFLEELFDRSSAAGILKDVFHSNPTEPTGTTLGIVDIKALIGTGEIKEAARELTNYLHGSRRPDRQIADELLLISGRIEVLQQKRMMGIIDERDAILEHQKISYALLDLINRAESA